MIKNYKFITTLSIIFFSLIIISTSMAVYSAEEVKSRELSGDKLTMERIEGFESEYKILAQGNALLIYDDMEISGENAKFNTAQNSICFNKNVKLEATDSLIKGNELSGNIDDQKYIFKGDVFFSYNQIEATADKVTYNMKDEMAYLEGNVKGNQNGRKFSADNINIDLKKEKIQLSGKAKLVFPDKGEK